ncbi:haloacid dehalogenase-like hydrolase [Candidatus Erwinia haradaeae]|uniref:Phosphatidylglycerophosphatase C n=1 Tax=Candidatus Erwinia haradaeae TaxID=1922217 RepID=A0A803FT41_9GAMM|nr:haloacid dehalogenase-like hydrolase [Candidatus Erwinia haradaeae]VFP87585.1 Phosphatidylglycerophosphatase C [Candidatus Erwinia haradaeae]
MTSRYGKCVIFFDLDGTLHREDMFCSFVLWLLRCYPYNLFLLIFTLPIIGLVLLVQGYSSRWSTSLLLWSITFGHSELSLSKREEEFSNWFRQHLTPFPKVRQHLIDHLSAVDTEVWLITGSPLHLVEMVYGDSYFLPRVKLLASQMVRSCGGRVLLIRCVGYQKVLQLELQLGKPLIIKIGYSDSKMDDPLLFFCQNIFRISLSGELIKMK